MPSSGRQGGERIRPLRSGRPRAGRRRPAPPRALRSASTAIQAWSAWSCSSMTARWASSSSSAADVSPAAGGPPSRGQGGASGPLSTVIAAQRPPSSRHPRRPGQRRIACRPGGILAARRGWPGRRSGRRSARGRSRAPPRRRGPAGPRLAQDVLELDDLGGRRDGLGVQLGEDRVLVEDVVELPTSSVTSSAAEAEACEVGDVLDVAAREGGHGPRIPVRTPAGGRGPRLSRRPRDRASAGAGAASALVEAASAAAAEPSGGAKTTMMRSSSEMSWKRWGTPAATKRTSPARTSRVCRPAVKSEPPATTM